MEPFALVIDFAARFDSRLAGAADTLRTLGQLRADGVDAFFENQVQRVKDARASLEDSLLEPLPAGED